MNFRGNKYIFPPDIVLILYQGLNVWNCIPASIANLSSFSTFKNKVLEFLLKLFLS